MKKVKILSMFLAFSLLFAACAGGNDGEQTPGSDFGNETPGVVGTDDLGGEELANPTQDLGGSGGIGTDTSGTGGSGDMGTATSPSTNDGTGSDTASATGTPVASGAGGNSGSVTATQQPGVESTAQGSTSPGIPVTGGQGNVLRITELLGFTVETSGGTREDNGTSGSDSVTRTPTANTGGSSTTDGTPTAGTGGSGSTNIGTATPGSAAGSNSTTRTPSLTGTPSSSGSGGNSENGGSLANQTGEVLGTVEDLLIVVGGTDGTTDLNSGAGDMGQVTTPEPGTSVGPVSSANETSTPSSNSSVNGTPTSGGTGGTATRTPSSNGAGNSATGTPSTDDTGNATSTQASPGGTGSGAGEMGFPTTTTGLKSNQDIRYLVVNADPSFGFSSGQRLVAIPWSRVIRVDTARNVIVVDISLDRFESFPSFGGTDFPDLSVSGWDSQWSNFWLDNPSGNDQ